MVWGEAAERRDGKEGRKEGRSKEGGEEGCWGPLDPRDNNTSFATRG